VADALVYVYVRGTSQATEAQLYTTADVAQTQPLTTDSAGAVEFRIADGVYDLVVSKTGHDTQTYEDIQIYSGSPYVFDVMDYGATGDGTTDDAGAIQDTIDACEAAGGGVVLIPEGTYSVSGTMITIPGNTVLRGDKATLKLAAGSYSENVYILGTREDPAYNAGLGWEDNITIEGLVIDGNDANVSFTLATYGCSGIQGHQVTNFTVRDCTLKEIPGEETGYGVSAWYSDGVSIENCDIDRTPRQNVLIWETTRAVVNGCRLQDSYFRGCVLVSTMSPKSYQESHAMISNCNIHNALAGGSGVNRGVRFSGESGGQVRGCKIAATDEGIYVIDDYSKDVIISDCEIYDCTYGLYIDVDTNPWKVSVTGCSIHGCSLDGVRAVSGPGSLIVNGCQVQGTTNYPVYTSAVDHAAVTGCILDGGNAVILDPGETAVFSDNVVTGMANASYAVFVNDTSSGLLSYAGNMLSGNTADKPRIEIGGHVDISGAGTPEGAVIAQIGATFRRTDGGAGTSFYVKEANADATGWSPVS